MNSSLGDLIVVVLALMGASIFVALLGLLMLMRSIRRLQIPHEAGFFTTLRHIPLALAVLLDLLDFGLDIFSAPIIWIVLSRMGLPNLRNKATIEALIPFTNVLPTFTLCWIAARVFDLGDDILPMIADRYDSYRQHAHSARRRPDPNVIDMDDYR